MATRTQRKAKPTNDPRFNLSIDEVEMIALYRKIAPCDRIGVVNALVVINERYGADKLPPEWGDPTA